MPDERTGEAEKAMVAGNEESQDEGDRRTRVKLYARCEGRQTCETLVVWLLTERRWQ